MHSKFPTLWMLCNAYDDMPSFNARLNTRGVTTVIHNKPIGESEQFIIINRQCQSHLMRRRHWFIGIFSFGISSAARLPRLSSPAMKDDWIYEREKENRYRTSAGGEEQRNNCEWRCVRGQNHRLVFEDLKRRGGSLGTCKRQPQLMEDDMPCH